MRVTPPSTGPTITDFLCVSHHSGYAAAWTSTTTVAPCFGYDMEGGAVHKSGGKGAALARATHRRVINYYPVRRARDTLPSTSSPRRATAYAAALTLLSPRCSPTGGPESRRRAAPHRATPRHATPRHAEPICARFYSRTAQFQSFHARFQ